MLQLQGVKAPPVCFLHTPSGWVIPAVVDADDRATQRLSFRGLGQSNRTNNNGNVVRGKTLSVLPEAKLFEPVRNLALADLKHQSIYIFL